MSQDLNKEIEYAQKEMIVHAEVLKYRTGVEVEATIRRDAMGNQLVFMAACGTRKAEIVMSLTQFSIQYVSPVIGDLFRKLESDLLRRGAQCKEE